MTFPYLKSRVYDTGDRWVPIDFRGRGVPSGQVYDSASTDLMDQQMYQAPSWGGISAIKLAYSGFDMDTYGEYLRGPTATIKASVLNKNPSAFFVNTNALASAGSNAIAFSQSFGAGIKRGMLVNSGGKTPAGTFVLSNVPTISGAGGVTLYIVTLSANITTDIASGAPVGFQYDLVKAKFGGQDTGALIPDFNFLQTDPIGVSLLANQVFSVRTHSILSAPGVVLQGYSNDVQLSGDACQRGTTANDLTLSPATPTHTGGGYFGPSLIMAKVSSWMPSLLVITDSIGIGVGDTHADAFGRTGWVKRKLGNQLPLAMLGRTGLASAYLQRSFTGHVAALDLAHITDVLILLCRNDLFSGIGVTGTKNAVAAIAAPYKAAGKRAWICTACPTNGSTGQKETDRVNYNLDRRANWASDGYAGCYDLAALLEDPSNPGNYYNLLSDDNTHPNGAGVDLLVAAPLIYPAMFPPYG
jgi:hypothetical protein